MCILWERQYFALACLLERCKLGVRIGKNGGDIESQMLILSLEGTQKMKRIVKHSEPVGAPQRIILSLAVDTGSRKVQLRISKMFGWQGELRFDWQMWKDAFIGRMQG
eukprot:IDg22832t1